MACNSLTALPRVCPDGVLAGVEKVYIIAFKDLKAINTGTTEVYSANTSGIVTTIGLQSGKTFVEIGLLKSTSGLNEALTKDNTKGTSFFTQTVSIVLSDMTSTNIDFVKNVVNQPVAILVKSRTSKWYAAGLNGQFEVSAVDGGTGVAEADLIGFTITFNGIAPGPAPIVLDSLVPTIIS
jgi:hypothetical protein